MPHDRNYKYEGLFLFPQSAVSDLQGASDHVLELLNRAGAQVISFKKWDERRLAYEVKGNKRGLYFLAYFKCDGGKMAHFERDCNLSEKLLRTMITRVDQITDEMMQAAEGRTQLADEIKLRATQPNAVITPEPTPVPVPDLEDDFELDDE